MVVGETRKVTQTRSFKVAMAAARQARVGFYRKRAHLNRPKPSDYRPGTPYPSTVIPAEPPSPTTQAADLAALHTAQNTSVILERAPSLELEYPPSPSPSYHPSSPEPPAPIPVILPWMAPGLSEFKCEGLVYTLLHHQPCIRSGTTTRNQYVYWCTDGQGGKTVGLNVETTMYEV